MASFSVNCSFLFHIFVYQNREYSTLIFATKAWRQTLAVSFERQKTKRTFEENMKKFITFFCIILFVNFSSCQSKNENDKFYKTEYDKIESKPFILDFENVFNKIQKDSLLKITKKFEVKTSAEICVITLDNKIKNSEELKTQSLYLANYLVIGKKEKSNGILICISKNSRLLRIENGDGITNLMTDLEIEKILNEKFIPEFKKGEYYNGTLNGINQIISELSIKIKNADEKNQIKITELLKIKSEEKFISGSCGLKEYSGCKKEDAENYDFSINLSIDVIILELKKYSNQIEIDKLILDGETRTKDINYIVDGKKTELEMIMKYFERIKDIVNNKPNG